MSSYKAPVINKKTGEEVECFFRDDYFAPRLYGYHIEDRILTDKEFDEKYIRKPLD